MAHEVVTLTLKEQSEKEEEETAAITAMGFVPEAPVAGQIAAYAGGTTYAKGALVLEDGIVYRSQVAGNIGHEPKADATFEHWAPQPVVTYPLVNPAFNHTPALLKEHGFESAGPPLSSAAAPAAETIEPGEEILEDAE
jgi:hypothetical protein